MSHILVVTTVANVADARTLARAMVDRRLAACAQICPIESFYHWNGAVQNQPEFSVSFKTVVEHYERIEAAIRAQHPYELPDIHALVLERTYAPYARWVERTTQSADPSTDASDASRAAS